jgi:hypothetical protein
VKFGWIQKTGYGIRQSNLQPLPAIQTTAIEFRIIPILLLLPCEKTHRTHRHLSFLMFSSGDASKEEKKERNPSEVNSHVKYLFI